MVPSLTQSEPAQTSRSYASCAPSKIVNKARSIGRPYRGALANVTLNPLKPAIFTAETIFM